MATNLEQELKTKERQLFDLRVQNNKLFALLEDVFDNPNYLTNPYFLVEAGQLRARYAALRNTQ